MIQILPAHLAPQPGDPPPLDWNVFAVGLSDRWSQLLDSDPGEAEVQSFLEHYPCLLPGPYGLFQGGHHGAFPAAVVPQPILPSYEHRSPDFLWLAADSMNYWAVSIELERPGKKWFTKAGTQTADLTQALGQLQDWRRWFSEPQNIQAFLEYYEVPRSPHHAFATHYVLIYGRRSEATQRPHAKKRAFIQRPDETLMTYDRLRPDPDLADVLTVRRKGGAYHAIYSQATMRPNRFTVSDWESVEGVEEVIRSNPDMSSDRKEYLVNLLAQWRDQLQTERAERRAVQP